MGFRMVLISMTLNELERLSYPI